MHPGSTPFDPAPYLASTGLDNRTGLAFIDRDGRFLFVSDGLAAMNGLPVAEHVGRLLKDVVPDAWAQVRDLFARVLAGASERVEFRAPTSADEGRVHEWVEYWSPVTVDEKVIGVTVTVMDVTELRQSQRRERELKLRQSTLRDIAQRALDDDAVDDVFAVALRALQQHLEAPLTRIARIVTGADSLQIVLGVGWDDDLMARVPTGPRSGSFAQFVITEGRAVQFSDLAGEQRFRPPAVMLAHGIASGIAAPICAGSRPWGMVAAYDRRERHFDVDDEAFMEELGTLLGLMMQERESRAFREEILSMASHEIRTPLTSVIGLAQHIRRRATQGRMDSAMELIDPMVAEAFRVDQVLSQWHELAAAESNRRALAPEQVDVGDTVAERVDEFRRRHPECTVHEDYARDVPTIESEGTRIAEIVDNLMENARKYAGGEIDISVRAAPPGVEVQCRDYGPGIQPDAIAHIFDRFYRGPDRSHGGMGLGLYISRKLAEGLGGTLSVTSPPGQGACFTLTLPPTIVRTSRISA